MKIIHRDFKRMFYQINCKYLQHPPSDISPKLVKDSQLTERLLETNKERNRNGMETNETQIHKRMCMREQWKRRNEKGNRRPAWTSYECFRGNYTRKRSQVNDQVGFSATQVTFSTRLLSTKRPGNTWPGRLNRALFKKSASQTRSSRIEYG